MTPLLTFGDLLRRYRVAASLTQEALAERARVSPRTISDLERGVTSWPYRDTVSLLAEALGLTDEDRAALESARRRPVTPSFSRSRTGLASDGDVVAVTGLQTTALPSHVQTFLIAENRTYAPLLHERGDAAGVELATRFAALVRDWLTAHEGHLIDLRGDEAVVAFGSARQALRAALELQVRAKRATSSEPAWPFSLGIGLDAGEAIAGEGGYHGAALHIAAHLASVAAVGEALASRGVAHLARRMSGLAYVDRGEMTLDGVGESVHAVQVVPEDAAQDRGMILAELHPQVDAPHMDAEVAALYRAAQAAATVENWGDALDLVQRLLTRAPDHQEAMALARRARAHREVPELYAKGRGHYDAGRWRAALDYFRQVQAIAGNYKGVFALMATAQYEIERDAARQESRATSSPALARSPAVDPMDAHYTQVIKALIDGRIVPFLGSDIHRCSRPAELPWRQGQYLPDDDELAAHLAQSFGYSSSSQSSLVRVSQHIAITAGTSPLYTALREVYDGDYPPTPVHHLLATLPRAIRASGFSPHYPLIVTAMYDDVLERTFDAADEPFDLVTFVAGGDERGTFLHCPPDAEPRPIERPNEYRGLSLDQRTIILKMHGAFDRARPERDSYVVTEDNYIDYLSHVDVSSLIPVTILAKLRTSHVLFLGYNLHDWNQRVVMHRIWGHRKLSDHYRSWALPVNPQPVDREFWHRWNVAVLSAPLDAYVAVLSERLQALRRAGATP